MQIRLSTRQYRRLLDLVYVGNWVMNSTRDDDRIEDYDDVEEALFRLAPLHGMTELTELSDGHTIPSAAFVEGGIHEAVMDYEDTVFFEILAEELARRDLVADGLSEEDHDELEDRICGYIEEFEENGIEHVTINN